MIDERRAHAPGEGVYWWRLPDDEAALMSLGHAELKCYLVVLRAIQRDRNGGRLSFRQIAQRAGLKSIGHVHTVMDHLVRCGMLACDVAHGKTASYRLPRSWRNCSAGVKQLAAVDEAHCSTPVEQLGPAATPSPEQHCSAGVEQNCSAGAEQHLEYSELRESSPQFSATVSDAELAEEQAQPASAAFVDFVRKETRVEIGGKMADEGTVRRLAALLVDKAGFELWRSHVREWSRNNEPQTWGILVGLARDVAQTLILVGLARDVAQTLHQRSAPERVGHGRQKPATSSEPPVDIAGLARALALPKARYPAVDPRVRAAVQATTAWRGR